MVEKLLLSIIFAIAGEEEVNTCNNASPFFFVFCSMESLKRVGELTGKPERISFKKVDLNDKDALEEVFKSFGPFEGCLHFAALKAVGESVQLPVKYYSNNLGGTFNLLECMQKYGCKSIIFSSSATVYGSAPVPITEVRKVFAPYHLISTHSITAISIFSYSLFNLWNTLCDLILN
jgi:GDP-D-mannose dehydratase